MFFSADNSTALFANLKLELVVLDGAGSIHCCQVPFIRKLYAILRRAIFLAVAAKNTGIVPQRNCPDRRIGLDIIFLAESFCGTDIHTGAASDTVIEVKLGLAPVLLGNYTGLSRKAGCKTRGKNS